MLALLAQPFDGLHLGDGTGEFRLRLRQIELVELALHGLLGTLLLFVSRSF